MFLNYIYPGISIIEYLLPFALIILCILNVIKFLPKGTVKLKLIQMLCEFLWILSVLYILKITGIIGGNFASTSIFTGNANINIGFFEEGLSPAMILNVILFIPFGFFSMFMFNSLKKSWIRGVLFGLIFSVTIEFLQTFIGRFAQVDDVLMNTIGTYIGCGISIMLLKLNQNKKLIQ